MKRTIFTSFFILVPMNFCYFHGELFQLNLLAIGMSLSVANHSHNYFTHDLLRKKIVNRLDQLVNGFNLVYPYYNGMTSFNCFLYGTSIVMLIAFVFIKYLLYTVTENYSPQQKTLHALWHLLFIFGITHYRLSCLAEA